MVYDRFPVLKSVPKELLMDYSRIINKPFFVQSFTWSHTSGIDTRIIDVDFPSSFIGNNLAKVPFYASALYRMRGCVILQVSGTSMHQGTLIAGVHPYGVRPVGVGSLLQCPHTFLYANEMTAACIEVPFYSTTSLKRTDYVTSAPGITTFNFATLSVLVLNQLASAGTVVQDLTVSVHFVVKEAEFYVPNSSLTWVSESGIFSVPTKIFDGIADLAKTVSGDIIDAGREGIRHLTGFHNPNNPVINQRVITSTSNFRNAIDQPTFLEKLDQHPQFNRITRDYIFGTEQDEMNVLNICKKPQYVGTITLTKDETEGKVLFARPISPMIVKYPDPINFSSPMRLFYENSRSWRGGLKLHIQSSMTSFHYCKLLVLKYYAGDPYLLDHWPKWDDIPNMMTETLEFTAGGQVKTVDLPYCSQLEQLECTKDFYANALTHGMFYVYLLQPLVHPDSVPSSVKFNFYISAADDLEFYGYAVDAMKSDVAVWEGESETIALASKASQAPLFNSEPEQSLKEVNNYINAFQPMTSVRDYIRRMQPVMPIDFELVPAMKGVVVLSVADLFSNDLWKATPLQAFLSLYNGIQGGLKLRMLMGIFKADGTPDFQTSLRIRVALVPPSWIYSRLNIRPTVPTTFDGSSNPQAPWFSELASYNTLVDPEFSWTQIDSPSTQTALNQFMFEYEIPNISPYNYISTSGFVTNRGSNVETDWGNIIIMIDNPLETGTYYLRGEIYAGFNDETRLGHQCLTTKFEPMTIGTPGPASVNVRMSAFNSSTTPFGILANAPPYPYFGGT